MKEYRYIFVPKRKPWWWFFSFWERRWKSYGEFQPVAPGEPGYEEAPYAMGLIHYRANEELRKKFDYL